MTWATRRHPGYARAIASEDAIRALSEFLLDAYSAEDLGILARQFRIPQRRAPRSLEKDRAIYAAHLVEELSRRGRVDGHFFDTLIRDRPLRSATVNSLRRLFTQRDLVYFACSHEDWDLARQIELKLRERGVRLWSDTAILPGDNWVDAMASALRRAMAVVVLVTPGFSGAKWLRAEIQSAFVAGTPVFPVLAEGFGPSDLPYGLAHLHGIQLEAPGAIDSLADAIRRVVAADSASEPSTPSPILDLALQFLRDAGRELAVREPKVLRVPELAVLAGSATATPLDVAAMDGLATQDEVSYFLHDGALPDSVIQRLGEMRLRGSPRRG